MPRRNDPPTSAVRTVHQFPVSTFCEKVRWILDAKGLVYTVRNLFPGRHAPINRKLTGKTSVPVLIDGTRVVHDSSSIAQYLEQTYPRPPLLPEDDGLRALVLALETYFDRTVGPAVRHWVYGQLLRKRGIATKVFFARYGRAARITGRVAGLVFERKMRAMHPNDEQSLEIAQRAALDGIERLENTIDRDPNRFLVGDALTLADITAASLLGPIVGPPQSPWPDSELLTGPMRAMRDRLRERPGGLWVIKRYEARHPSSAPASGPRLIEAPPTAPAAPVAPAS